ncbi:MAG: hypothetical protein ACYSR0_11840, partial [Planctomycetota bacterium]
MRYLYVINLLWFIIIFPSVWASEIEGPVDHTIEPVLSSEWVCYVREGGLYVKQSGEQPLKIRSAKEAKASILSPDMKAHDNTLFISWIEKGFKGNRLFFTSLGSKDKSKVQPIELSVNTKAMRTRIFVDNNGNLFVLEIVQGSKPELLVNLSSDGGLSFKRLPLDTEGVDSLYYPTPVVVDDTLYVFFNGEQGNNQYLGMKAYELPSLRVRDSELIRKTGGISFIEAFNVKNSPLAVYKRIYNNRFVLDVAVKINKKWDSF